MSDPIRGPMGPGDNPEYLNFEALQGDGHRDEEKKEGESEKEQIEARLDALGIDSKSYTEDQIRLIVKRLEKELVMSNTPNDLLEGLLKRYGFDLSKRNLPQGAIPVVINSVIGTVVLTERSSQSARDAVEAILRKHQVADRNPFGL